MLKGVLFDLDQTLVDFMKMKRMSVEAAVSAMIDSGLEMPQKEATEKLFEIYGETGIEYQRIFQRFLKETKGEIDYKILANAIAAYRRVQVGFLTPYPKTRSTLTELQKIGLKLGIVSDAPKIRAWLRLAEMNLTDYFEVVVTLDDTGKLKPSPAPFKTAAEQLGLMPNEILFVGDNPERDIKGAKEFGMRTCYAKYGSLGKRENIKADFEINSIDELISLCRG